MMVMKDKLVKFNHKGMYYCKRRRGFGGFKKEEQIHNQGGYQRRH